MGFVQYLKDTRAEMNHVAWPTRIQTVVFTILVILVSVFTALYLGFFDYIFTSTLARSLEFIGSSQPSGLEIQTAPATSSTIIDIPSSFDITDTAPAE